jgi:hypothetical protein
MYLARNWLLAVLSMLQLQPPANHLPRCYILRYSRNINYSGPKNRPVALSSYEPQRYKKILKSGDLAKVYFGTGAWWSYNLRKALRGYITAATA